MTQVAVRPSVCLSVRRSGQRSVFYPVVHVESPVFPPTGKRTTNERTGALALPTNCTRGQGNVDFSKLTSGGKQLRLEVLLR